MRCTVTSRNGEGTRPSARLYGSDHSWQENVCCSVDRLFCCTFFVCIMSRAYVVLISVCNSKVSVKLHNQADGGVAKKRKIKTSAKWSTDLMF